MYRDKMFERVRIKLYTITLNAYKESWKLEALEALEW